MAHRYNSVPGDDLEDDNGPPSIAINVNRPPIERTMPVHVLVRFNEGADVGLMVNTTDKVARVKEMLISTIPALQERSLRLIHNGRVLRDDSPLSECVRITTSSPDADRDKKGKAAIRDSPPVYLHCAVGDKRTVAEVQVDTSPQITPLVGFDRLQAAGFSDEDIASIRLQFHRTRGSNIGPDDTIDEQARQMEEAWIDNQGAEASVLPDGGRFDPMYCDITYSSAPDGTYVEMLQGLLIGFFFGLFALFWFKEQGIFTKRQQMAIIAGLVISASFGMLHVYY